MGNFFKYCLLLVVIPIGEATLSAQPEGPPYIKSTYFGGGSYYIDPEQIRELHEFLESIEGLEQYNIVIHSHTDNIGSLEYNQWLSYMRSQAVLKVLEKWGIPPEAVTIDDFGELNPVYNNATWEGKLRNRRADVFLLPPNT